MSSSTTQFDRSRLANPRPLAGEMEFAISLVELAYRPDAAPWSNTTCTAPTRGQGGSNGGGAGPDHRRERRGNVKTATPLGSTSAALGGGRNVLARDLRERM